MFYTYSIKFIITDQWYYGVRYAKNAKYSDLGTTYFSSSTLLKKLIIKYGEENFICKIRKKFTCREDAILHEKKFLMRVCADKNPKFLNKRIITTNVCNSSGKIVINDGSIHLFWDDKQPIPEGFVRGRTDSAKLNNSIAQKKARENPLNKFINIQPVTGPCSENRRQAISNARKHTKKITCKHCNKNTDPGNYIKSHGDNCRYNPDIDPRILKKRTLDGKKYYQERVEKGTQHNIRPITGDFICPYCGKHGTNYGNIRKYHFDNCKYKESTSSSEK